MGVASRYLCYTLAVGEHAFGYIQPATHFRLPSDERPIVMIGAGTGIAPYRAFLQKRASKMAENVLFFGERNIAYDFYYKEFLQDCEKRNILKLITAFSRDQPAKIYVQDRLLEHGRMVYDLIMKKAFFYVCGDKRLMAKAVHKSLVLILMRYGGFEEKKAFKFLLEMQKEKRYQRDVY